MVKAGQLQALPKASDATDAAHIAHQPRQPTLQALLTTSWQGRLNFSHDLARSRIEEEA